MSILFAATALLLSGAPPVVVARVDAEVVTLEQVRARQAATRAAGGNDDPAGIVEDLVNEALLAKEGYRLGLQKTPAVVEAAEAERRRAASELLAKKELSASGLVKDDQLRALYHDTGDSVALRMIIVATEDEAKALVGRLAKGADFTKEAVASLDPRGQSKGGDLGTVSRGQLDPEVQAVAFAAPLGKVQGPVKLRLGWGVVEVKARYVADEAGFDARREAIRRFAEQEAGKQLKAHYLEQLRAKHKVAVDEAFLKGTGTSIDATPAQASHALATVAGRPVTYGQTLERLVRAFGRKQGSHVSGFSVKAQLAWELIDEALLGAAALEAGLGRDPSVVQRVKAAERDAVVRALAQQTRDAAATPTEAELRAFHASHQREYLRAGTRTCSHLVVRSRDIAAQLKQRLERGEAFEELAREYSSDRRTAAQGGLLGAVSDDQLAALERTEPALAAGLRQARPGAVAGPLQTRSGWHLVDCGAQTPAAPVPYDELRAVLTQRLSAERGVEAVKAKVAALRAKAKVVVDRGALGATSSAGGGR